jgi:hypothetical protein
LRLYERAGEVMDQWRREMPEAVASTPEIGVFAYHYRGKVLDPYGLVSPEALDVLRPDVQESLKGADHVYHPMNVYVYLKPEFVMTAGLFVPYVPQKMSELYEEFSRPDVPFLRLFVRRDLPESLKQTARGDGTWSQ